MDDSRSDITFYIDCQIKLVLIFFYNNINLLQTRIFALFWLIGWIFNWLGVFYGITTFVGYLILNPLNTYILFMICERKGSNF